MVALASTMMEKQIDASCVPDAPLVAQMMHTAPEWCQPDKLATLSFSAFLVICDQDKKPHVGQKNLKGGNFVN